MAKKTCIKQGWHKEDIKSAIRKLYVTFEALAQKHEVHSSYLRMALLYPKPKAEGIIARALGVTPMELWPERYTDEILANHRHWRRNDNVHAVKFNTNDKDSTVNR